MRREYLLCLIFLFLPIFSLNIEQTVKRGDLARDRYDLPKAARLYKQALDISPDTNIKWKLITVYIMDNRYTEAVDLLSTLPDDSVNRKARSIPLLVSLGRFDEALTMISSLPESEQRKFDSAKISAIKGLSLLNNDDLLEELIDIADHDVDSMVRYYDHVVKQNSEVAFSTAIKITKIAPKDIRGKILLIASNAERGDDAALTSAADLMKSDPDSSLANKYLLPLVRFNSIFSKAKSLKDTDPATALRKMDSLFNRKLIWDPLCDAFKAKAHLLAAELALVSNNYAAAIEHAEFAAARGDDETIFASLKIGAEAHEALGETAKAVEKINRAININPRDNEARNIATRLQQQQQTASANYPDYDLYEVLGVTKNSDAKAIRSAYKKLAKEYHPDSTSGTLSKAEKEEKFAKISAAWSVLGNPSKKADYDQYKLRQQSYGGNNFRTQGGFNGGFPGGGFGNFHFDPRMFNFN